MRGDKVEIDISVFPVFLSEKLRCSAHSFAHSVPLTMISLFSIREFRRVFVKNAIDAKSNGARSIDPHGTNYTLIPNAFNRSRRVSRLLNNVP